MFSEYIQVHFQKLSLILNFCKTCIILMAGCVVSSNETMNSRMDQVKSLKIDNLQKHWSNIVCLNRSYHFKFVKVCFHKTFSIHSLMHSLHKKMKFSIEDFFSKCDQIRRKLGIWSHLLKKYLIENFIFCTVIVSNI